MATHEITLDVTKKEITPQVIHTRVGDSNTTIKATVTNDGAAYSLSGATVKFKAAKPDGTYAEQSATVSGSTATVTLAPEFLAVPGIIKTAYFEITASGKKDTTGNVWIDNRADAEGEAPDLSTSYIPTVDQLVEDATEALNSANTALGNVEEALEDAEAATDSATDAAASANAAASAAQSAIDAMTGNVLRGTVGPSEVVSADDAYAQTPLGLTVYGNTRQNLWVNPSGTKNGITVTSNDDGSVSISGTSTSSGAYIGTNFVYTLKPSTQYTVSVDKAVGFQGFYVTQFKTDGTNVDSIYFGNEALGDETIVTFTTDQNLAYVRFGVGVNPAHSGTTYSGTYRVMLNEGSEAQPWCPPGLNSVEDVTVWQAGKNLLSVINMGNTVDEGITYEYLGDGYFHVHGTATSRSYKPIDYTNIKSALNYSALVGKTLTASRNSNNVGCYFGYFTGEVGGEYKTLIDLTSGSSKSAVVPEEATWSRAVLTVAQGVTVDEIVRFQLELGSAATEYEPPNVASTPIDLDGNQLCSLPDGTRDELRIDESGAATLVKRCGIYAIDGNEDWFKLSGRETVFGVNSWSSDVRNYLLLPNLFLNNSLPNGAQTVDIDGKSGLVVNGKYQLYASVAGVSDVNGIKEFFQTNETSVIYPLATPQEISLDAVTLPALPAPNANVWASAEVPCDVELEYARDVTLVVGSLEAKVAALELLHETE